jgi:hypothetical protein
MASAVNRVSEARFPAETLKQRAAGGHQSSWFELIPPLREKNRRRSRIARDYPINAHDRFARFYFAGVLLERSADLTLYDRMPLPFSSHI